MGGLLQVDLAVGELAEGLGDRAGKVGEADGAVGGLPQAQGQPGHRLPAFLDLQVGGGALWLGPRLLVPDPALEQQPVQLGGGDLAALVAGLAELLVGQVGDEGEHARVAGQAEQVADVAEQLEAGLGPPVSRWSAARL